MVSHPLTRPLLVCIAVAIALRLPFLETPLGSDEAGLLLVVRHWDPGPEALYGDHWVDRPPLLLAYFWLADLLSGVVGVRLLGCLVGALLVGAAVVAGYLLRGAAGAWWAGLAGAVLSSSYVIAAHLVNGMVQGVALTMTSCALTVAATRGDPGPRRLYGLLVASGAAGTAAVLVKQNLACGLAFGAVVVVASRSTGELTTRRTILALGAALAGTAGVLAVTVLWALAVGVDLGLLWFALYEFRSLAIEVIAEASRSGLPRRLDSLTLAAVLSGLALVVLLLVGSARRTARNPQARRYLAGTMAVALVAMVGIVLGGSWWRHYLVQLVPAAVLVTALVAPLPGQWGRAARASVAIMAVSAVVGAVSGALVPPPDEVRVGRHLAGATRRRTVRAGASRWWSPPAPRPRRWRRGPQLPR